MRFVGVCCGGCVSEDVVLLFCGKSVVFTARRLIVLFQVYYQCLPMIGLQSLMS
jgi:hypothetical protein